MTSFAGSFGDLAFTSERQRRLLMAFFCGDTEGSTMAAGAEVGAEAFSEATSESR